MKTIVLMYLEFYRADGSWIGSAAHGAEINGEFATAEKIQFEGRIEVITHDEEGNIV